MKRSQANLLMVFGTMIWGLSFVFQNLGSQYIEPFTFGAIRYFLGAMVILPIVYKNKKNNDEHTLKEYVVSSIICGGTLFLGAYFQQIGIMNTTVGKSGFVTSLYIILVPFMCLLFYRRKIEKSIFISTILAVIGIYLLCVNESFSVNIGDIYNFIGAIFWALQIIFIEKFASKLDGVKFAVFQFLACSFFNAVGMIFFENPTIHNIALGLIPLLYSGLLSVGFGFTAQIICLKYTDATVASLIMSLESVFSVIFGFLILHEVLTFNQVIGCLLVFAGVLLAQINPKKFKRG